MHPFRKSIITKSVVCEGILIEQFEILQEDHTILYGFFIVIIEQEEGRNIETGENYSY